MIRTATQLDDHARAKAEAELRRLVTMPVPYRLGRETDDADRLQRI